MEDDFIESALREEARLKRRLAAVQALIADYRTDGLRDRPSDVGDVRVQTQVRQRTARTNSKAAAVMRIAEEYLLTTHKRAPSTELYEEIKRHGVEIPGQKPEGVVASYLSNSDKFDNVRGQGYGLTIWKNLNLDEAPSISTEEAS
jgi:hypothetical protein